MLDFPVSVLTSRYTISLEHSKVPTWSGLREIRRCTELGFSSDPSAKWMRAMGWSLYGCSSTWGGRGRGAREVEG